MAHCWLALLILASAGSSEQTTTAATSARPIVELAIQRFADGERVWFWVGVELDSKDRTPIPSSLVSSLRVIVTRPDGSERVDVVGPECGFCSGVNTPGDQGWRIGYSLGTEKVQLGRWQVRTEFAGRRAPTVSFTVEEVPLLKDIRTEFVIPSPLVVGSTARLVVRNQSSEVIRFLLPGQNGTSVSIKLERPGGGGAAFFVPATWLPKSNNMQSEQSLAIFLGRVPWEYARDHFVLATVLPGGTYELSVPIADAILEHSAHFTPGEYTITLSTPLDIMPGEPDGPWKDFAPIRISATSTTKARWR